MAPIAWDEEKVRLVLVSYEEIAFTKKTKKNMVVTWL